MTCRYTGFLLGLDNNLLAKTSGLIDIHTVGNIVDYVFKLNLTAKFGNDYGIERIPFRNNSTLFHYITLVYEKFCTVGNVLRGDCDSCIFVYKVNLCQTSYNDFTSRTVIVCDINCTKFLEFQTGFVFRHNGSVCCCIGSHTTGVECTESKLCTRLTD